jgi:signal transduction histidine kinase
MAQQGTKQLWPPLDATYYLTSPTARMVSRVVRTVLVLAGLVLVVVALPGSEDRLNRQLGLIGIEVVLLATTLVLGKATAKQNTPVLIGCLVVRIGLIVAAYHLNSEPLAIGTMVVTVLVLMQVAPVAVAIGFAVTSVVALTPIQPEPSTILAAVATVLGYLTRRDKEARESARAMLRQERAARVAEQTSQAAKAEAAALAERSRIAREIHDVLASSLSAQLVHLEGARLLIDRISGGDEVREQIVIARRMAEDGLVQAREAVLALRGQQIPLAEQLTELAADRGARFSSTGEARLIAPEPALAVRGVAIEAMTNVRKHAPGNEITIELEYQPDSVRLHVADRRPEKEPVPRPTVEVAAELATSGAGYGIQGMRERAELLGGSLVAEPTETGFRVLLEVPA